MVSSWRVRRSWMGVLFFLLACGEGGPTGPDPALEPFVGSWDAVVMTWTGHAPPNVVADVLQFGSFSFSVEPSGQYTARLEVLGNAAPEIGQLSVSGSTLTLTPSYPVGAPVATATFSFSGADSLTMEGPGEFDFNLDQVKEAAQLHLELVRR